MHRQHASQLSNRIVVSPGMEKKPANAGASAAQRVQLSGATGPCQRLIHAAMARQPIRVFDVRGRVVGIQRESLLVFSLSVSPLELLFQNRAKQRMRLRKARIQFQGLVRRANRLWTCFERWNAYK